MAKPILLVVAGCNGSGKSTFSKYLVANTVIPFDYDYYYLKYYKSLLEIDIKQEMAHNMAWQELERQIEASIKTKSDFCYETNFNSTPLHWPGLFKNKGYELRVVYLCLNSVAEAKRRVAIRVQSDGHYVPDAEVEKRYYEGFANLDNNYAYFDCIDLFETSAYGKEPEYLFSVVNSKRTNPIKEHTYLQSLIPSILKLPLSK